MYFLLYNDVSSQIYINILYNVLILRKLVKFDLSFM
jgi:hypothetical protein